MNNNRIGLIYTTIGNPEDAENLANKALEKKLAKCINLIPNCKSIYLFDEKINNDSEIYMIFKTSIAKIIDLENFIVKNHPYSLPSIIKFESSTTKEFFNFIIT